MKNKLQLITKFHLVFDNNSDVLDKLFLDSIINADVTITLADGSIHKTILAIPIDIEVVEENCEEYEEEKPPKKSIGGLKNEHLKLNTCL